MPGYFLDSPHIYYYMENGTTNNSMYIIQYSYLIARWVLLFATHKFWRQRSDEKGKESYLTATQFWNNDGLLS